MTVVEPQPHPDPASDLETDYWERLAEGDLPVQRCEACNEVSHPPRPYCPECYSSAWRLESADGAGTVVSYAAIRRPADERFADEVPITSAVVALVEGPHVMGIVDGPVEDVSVGTAVRLDPSNLSSTDRRLVFELEA